MVHQHIHIVVQIKAIHKLRTVKVVNLARFYFGDSPVLDELVCFYFHGAEFTPIDLCTKETYWHIFILAFVKF